MPALFNVFINMHRKHHNNCQLLVFRYTECHYCRSKNISRQKPLTASVTPSKRTEFPSFKLGLIQNHPGRANSFSYRKLQRSPNLSHSVSIYMNPGQAFGVIKSKQLPRSWDSPVMHLAGGERSGVSPFQSWAAGERVLFRTTATALRFTQRGLLHLHRGPVPSSQVTHQKMRRTTYQSKL